jgi:hypothetical protein
MGYPQFRFVFGSWGWVWFWLSSGYPELEPDLGTWIFQVPAQHWFLSSVKPLAMNFIGIGLTLIFSSWRLSFGKIWFTKKICRWDDYGKAIVWHTPCLFCLPHWDLPNHGTSCHTLDNIVGKPLMSRGALFGFIMFWPMSEKLLNFEQFFHWKVI